MKTKKEKLRYKLRVQRFRNAVKIRWGSNDKYQLLGMADKLLNIWAGERLWNDGYGPDLKEMRLLEKEMDYHSVLGVCADITAEQYLSMRRYCYQFVKLADRITNRYEDLETEHKKLESHPLVRMMQAHRENIRYLRAFFISIPGSIIAFLRAIWHFRFQTEEDDEEDCD